MLSTIYIPWSTESGERPILANRLVKENGMVVVADADKFVAVEEMSSLEDDPFYAEFGVYRYVAFIKTGLSRALLSIPRRRKLLGGTSLMVSQANALAQEAGLVEEGKPYYLGYDSGSVAKFHKDDDNEGVYTVGVSGMTLADSSVSNFLTGNLAHQLQADIDRGYLKHRIDMFSGFLDMIVAGETVRNLDHARFAGVNRNASEIDGIALSVRMLDLWNEGVKLH